MLTFGPLNHFRALTSHHITIPNIRPPYTRQVQFIAAALLYYQYQMYEGDRLTYSRSDPVTLGNIRIGTIKATNAHAAVPIGRLALPRCQGPLLNRSPTKKTRMNIGMVKATKAATAAIEKRAPAASDPPKTRSVMRMPMVVLNHTALTGVWVCLFTRLIQKEKGKQSSRA